MKMAHPLGLLSFVHPSPPLRRKHRRPAPQAWLLNRTGTELTSKPLADPAAPLAGSSQMQCKPPGWSPACISTSAEHLSLSSDYVFFPEEMAKDLGHLIEHLSLFHASQAQRRTPRPQQTTLGLAATPSPPSSTAALRPSEDRRVHPRQPRAEQEELRAAAAVRARRPLPCTETESSKLLTSLRH